MKTRPSPRLLNNRTDDSHYHWTKKWGAGQLHGSVSHLPFPDQMFALATAVETHFYWPDLPADTAQSVRRGPGGLARRWPSSRKSTRVGNSTGVFKDLQT